MNWDTVIDVSRLALIVLGLVLVGRLLRTGRIYLSWSAFLYYGLAWLAFASLAFLRLRPFGLPDLGVLRQLFEILFLMGVAGSLLEHVRADRRRDRAARRLLEQWRQASGLSRERADELEALAGATSRLVASLELRQVLPAVVDHALRLVGADAAVVYLIDGETGTLRLQGVSASAHPAQSAELPAPRPRGVTAGVVREGTSAFIADTRQHPLFQVDQDEERPRPGALASVALKVSGGVIGVLNLIYHQPRVFDADDCRLLLALADIAALAVHNATQHERLFRLAVTDDLTGLPNRRRFLEALRSEAQRARRYQRSLALLMLDLDGLKSVNDRHGHATGDAVLRGVAHVLRLSTRDTDLSARLSGDEFAVILPETEAEAALLIAERIRNGVAAYQVPVEGGTVGATVSVGLVGVAGAALPELPRFLRLADEALYQAKAAGRNTIHVSPGPGSRDASSVASSATVPPQ